MTVVRQIYTSLSIHQRERGNKLLNRSSSAWTDGLGSDGVQHNPWFTVYPLYAVLSNTKQHHGAHGRYHYSQTIVFASMVSLFPQFRHFH